MACLSSIHLAIARLQAVSTSPVPQELVCVGPSRNVSERKIQPYAQLKCVRAGSSVSSGLRSKLLVLTAAAAAAAAGQDTATSTLVLQEVDFVWKGEASEVLLTGDFLGWDRKVSLLKGDDGAYHCKQKLSPGTFKYKFIVDGEWVHSQDNPTVADGQGGFNNLITVTDGSSAPAHLPNSQSLVEGSSPSASAKGMAGSTAAAKVSTSAEGTSPTANAKGTADSGAAKVSTSAEGTSPTASAKGTADSGTAVKLSSSAEGTFTSPGATAGSGTTVKSSSSTESTSPTAASAKGMAVSGATGKASTTTEDSISQAVPKATPAARPAKQVKVEKPYPQIMIEDVAPKIKSNLQQEKDISDVDVVFKDNQLEGSFMKNGIIYTFWAFFPDGKLAGSRGFSLSSHGAPPSTVEPFLIDEKKITAELLVFWVMKRLFAQKLLSLN